MKKDDNKNEQTIIFSKINPAEIDDNSENDRDFDLERTQEIKQIKLTAPDDQADYDEEYSEESEKELKKRLKAEAKERKRMLKAERKLEEQNDKTINMTDIRAARKKVKVHRRMKKLLIIAVIAALGAGVYLTRDKWIPKLEGILDKSHDTIVNDGTVQSGNFPIELGESSVNIIRRMDNNIIISDDGHMYFYDENGKLRDTVYHNFGSPVIKTAGKRILSFDNGGNTFRVYSKSGEIYEKKIEDPIIYAEIAENSSVAIITQTEKYAACLTVYDSNGTEIYRWSCGQRIMDISFTENGDGCYVSAFSSENGEIVSQIHYVEFDKTEELMKSELLDSLVLDISVNDNGNLWAVGDEKFYLLDSKGKLTDSYEYTSDIVSFAVSDECAAVITAGISHETMEIAVFDSDSDNAQPKLVESDRGSPKKAVCDGDRIFVLSSRTLDAYDSKGNLLATASVSSDYTDFVYYNDAVYFVGHRQVNKILFET